MCLLAGPCARAATAVDVDVRGVDDELRDNVLAYLSFERYKKGGADLTPDIVERHFRSVGALELKFEK